MAQDWKERLSYLPNPFAIFFTGPPAIGKSCICKKVGEILHLPVKKLDQAIIKDQGVKRLKEVSDLPDFPKIEGRVFQQTIENLEGINLFDLGGSGPWMNIKPPNDNFPWKFPLQAYGVVVRLVAPHAWILERIQWRIKNNGDDGGIDMQGCSTYEELLVKRELVYRDVADFTIPVIDGNRDAAADFCAETLIREGVVPRIKRISARPHKNLPIAA